MSPASSRRPANCSAHETTSSFSGDAEAFPNWKLLRSPSKARSELQRRTVPEAQECQAFEEVAFNTYHHGVFRSRITVCHQVTEGCVAIVTDRLVKADRGGEAVQFGICLIEIFAVAGSLSERSTQA